jgi:putative endonuclease
MVWYVYILQSAPTGHLYTGTSVDPDRRLVEHNTKARGAKRTKAGRPWLLVYSERSASRSLAQRREAAIKRLTRPQKLALIAE